LKRIHQIYLQHETLGGEERIEHLLDLMERIDELQRNIKNKNQYDIMTTETLDFYLKLLGNSKNEIEKEQIFDKINDIVKNESTQERKQGISSISKAVDKIAKIIDDKHLQLTH